MPPQIEIVRADGSLIPFVMACERRPGYDSLVGRWDEARHGAALRDGRHAYFIGRVAGEPMGFAILRTGPRPSGSPC